MTLKIVAIAVLAALVGACSKHQEDAPVVATVGDHSISEAFFDYYARKQTGIQLSALSPERKGVLLEDLKRLEAGAARGEPGEKPDLQHEIELSRLNILAHAAAVSAGVYAAPSDAELQRAYREFVAAVPANEYHVAHILVATESAASVLITRLQGGQDFAQLAASQSADDSKKHGGDLGWIAPGKLPAAFTDAVKTLKPGAFTLRPVKTNYGWHIIKLLETRAGQALPLDQVKAQLIANLQQERYQKFLDDSLRVVNVNP